MSIWNSVIQGGRRLGRLHKSPFPRHTIWNLRIVIPLEKSQRNIGFTIRQYGHTSVSSPSLRNRLVTMFTLQNQKLTNSINLSSYEDSNEANSITPDDLITETARAYGFKRTGGKISTTLKAVYEQLLSDGILKVVDGKVGVV